MFVSRFYRYMCKTLIIYVSQKMLFVSAICKYINNLTITNLWISARVISVALAGHRWRLVWLSLDPLPWHLLVKTVWTLDRSILSPRYDQNPLRTFRIVLQSKLCQRSQREMFSQYLLTRSKFSRNETKQLVQLIKIKPVMSEYAIVSSLKLKAKGWKDLTGIMAIKWPLSKSAQGFLFTLK